MQLLLYTNLYPSDAMPRHGIFVEERLRQLTATGALGASVCALRPTVTLNPLSYFRGSKVSATEVRNGIAVHYVPVPTLPLLTNWIDPWLWARASKRAVRQLAAAAGEGVILDAHFMYPDGVAAVILGRALGIPVVITARGSDVNVKATNPVMRRWMRWASKRSAAVITVSQALKDRLCGLGISADRVHALPNGVDLQRFHPDRARNLRSDYQLSGPLMVSVGHLIEGKGHHFAIEALTRLPTASLLIVGEGPERNNLERLAEELGVAARVRFLGLVSHDELAGIYGGCDVTVLASSNEGMPNVVLESLACGTRVVATDVGGVREVITAPSAGRMMTDRSAEALAASARRVLDDDVDRQVTREFASRFGWLDTVQRQLSLYERVAAL